MAEPVEEADVGGPDLAASGSDGLAAALIAALGRRGGAGKADPEFEAFLRQQTRLSELQTEHLHEQRAVILSRLRWGRFSDRIKALLQVLTLMVGLAVAAAIATMAWEAYEDHGVAIQAFSVPPDFAQRGLTGQVVAEQLLDRLSDLQGRTVSTRPASTYADDWGDDIKVEIPETGVSIGELNRYLRDWLGSETRISGEIVRTPAGLAVTVRAGDAPGRRFDGPEGDVDRLIVQAAEAIYAQTQPYRYAVYLVSQGETDQALTEYQRLAEGGDPRDRAWAYLGWASLLWDRFEPQAALAPVSNAIRLDRRIDSAYALRENVNNRLGRIEPILSDVRSELGVLGSGGAEGFSPEADRWKHDFVHDVLMAQFFGDYAQGLAASDRAGAVAAAVRMSLSLNLEGAGGFSSQALRASFLIGLHDPSAALRLIPAGAQGAELRTQVADDLDDWPAALSASDQMPASMRSEPRLEADRATDLAHLGRFEEARAAIAPTALDCVWCLFARGEIAALRGDRQHADEWFADAARQMPSMPFANSEWGEALLTEGDPDAAIVKLREAHKLGPHYADPLEVWGEALMAKHDYAAAIPKFAEADNDAPKWGRNHLRWGEALMLAGRYAEARAQYQIASGLDLSVGDRAALNVLLAHTATAPLHG